MKPYGLDLLYGDRAAAQARGYDGHHGPGGWTIAAFVSCPWFVGMVAQEYREMMGERVRGGIGGALAGAVAAFLCIAGHLAAAAPFAAVLVFFAAYRLIAQYDPIGFEIRSHALTVRGAVRYDGMAQEVVEREQAYSLGTYGGGGDSVEGFIAKMRPFYADADKWLDAHDAQCREWAALKVQPVWPL